ncbi:hypothetical protein B0T14DRAFT_493770 [Immersiella caudata]|uniref:Uncharacterized protein n=1 Tax=Immersiella caudata TaxID=314043 RepID=A0AA39X5L8_9PEZI|nr:hypothetical protein B0T14DRAFT_493770 [Immersiella caudata]
MVGRRRVLLSIAVLGVEAVFGGPLGRREDVAFNNTPAAVPPRPPPIPTTRPTQSVVVEITASLNLGDDAGAQQPTTPAAAPPAVPTRPGAPPAIPSLQPPLTVEEGAIDFSPPTTVPSRPGAPPGLPAVQDPPMVVEEEVFDFGAPTTTTAAAPTVPTRPGAPPALPVVPKPPLVVEEEAVDLGAPTTTAAVTTTPPARPGGPPVVPNPPVVVEEEEFDLGSPTTKPPTVPTVPSRPGGVPPVVAPPAKVISVESDFDFGGGPSPNTDFGNGVQTEYTYPGVWVSGSLVTQTNAFTRPVVPSMKSVPPNTSTRRPPRPPGVPDPGVDADAGDPEPEPDAVPPTPPRGPPPPIQTTAITAAVTESHDFDLGVRPTPNSNAHGPSSPPPMTTEPPASICQSSDIELLHTTYSIVYTTTLTWVGNPEDYTPLYPPVETPKPPDCVVGPNPARLTLATTISWCSSTGTGTKFVTCLTTTSSWIYNSQHAPTATEALMGPGSNFGLPEPSNMVTVITTDKNPAVVFATKPPPNYGVTSAPRTQEPHNAVTTPAPNNNPPDYGQNDEDGTKGPMREPPSTPPVTVAVKPTAVVINDHTIVDDPSGKTQVVVVGGVTFTIGPSQVIGGGATIDRNTITGGFASTPTSTRLGNINVVVSSDIAVVGGSSFTLGPTSRTAIVDGQTVVIAPSGVIVGGETLIAPTVPRPTEVVVAGGDLITAIGQSVLVIQSTTITYGLTGSSTTVIDNDTITFGPGGVTIHGTTLGGTAAKPGATDFAVAGGATITKIGASVVVIGGTTYTVGPGSGTTTTVVGGETITIGPDGIKVSTLTLPWPFGPTTVITPKATPTGPSATAAEASEDAAPGLRPEDSGFIAALCLALGMVFLGV